MNAEFGKIKTAAEALEEAYEQIFNVARPGMTAGEIDDIISSNMGRHGGEMKLMGNSPFIVREDGAPPKLRIDRVPLEKNHLWGMDSCVNVDGYWADIGRYGYFGSVPETLKADHARVLERQDILASQVMPGRPMDKIFEACPQDMPFEIHLIATDHNMKPFCGNAVPGVVKSMAESVEQGLTYQPGQVVCVEIWAGMMGGIEDMYLVTKNGLERITTLPREIREI